jgi:hypothetical protein
LTRDCFVEPVRNAAETAFGHPVEIAHEFDAFDF